MISPGKKRNSYFKMDIFKMKKTHAKTTERKERRGTKRERENNGEQSL